MKYNNFFNLSSKVCVVTGGTGLIGKALVEGLAESKAKVVLADIDTDKGVSTARKLSGCGLKVIFKYLDVTSDTSVSELIDFAHKKYKRIDTWINSAYPRTRDWGNKFEDISLVSWRKNIDMHLGGYFLCSQKIAEYMKRQKRGSIINLASIYGITAPDFSLYQNTDMTMPVAYSVIKAGIINFTKYLASYYGKYKIRVNCVSPGGVFDGQPRVFVKRYIQKTALRRMAAPEDVAGAVIYLASDASRYVTGHNLIVDGGWSII